MNKLILIMLLTVVVTACTTNKSKFVEVKASSESETALYIYRPYSMSNMMITPEINIDGIIITDIKNSSYHYFFLSQGKHTVKLEVDERYSGVQKVDIDLQQAKTVYLRVNTSLKFEKNKPYSRSFSLQVVDKETALTEIQTTQYAGKEKAAKKEELENEIKSSADSQDEIAKDQFTIQKTRNPFAK
ncbi:MAG: DUF2846 domain-containing protein [Gammaproteobacteria bacterium]|nr:DUF2846 domain-containing protein [Gammaproteobacteria bacterium]